MIRRKKNHIWAVEKQDRDWISNRADIDNYFETNFQNLFYSTNPLISPELESLYSNPITDEENFKLCKILTGEEIKNTVLEMNPLKAPGPDGMLGVLYHNYWSIVGPQIDSFV